MLRHPLKSLLVLTKAKITFFVSVTAIAAYLLYAGEPGWPLLPMAIGLFLLASGSAAFNEYQERLSDAVMPRTRERPIPGGMISAQAAAGVALVLVVSGSLLLFYGVNTRAFAWGLLALIWYNGVYLFLKRRTAFAVVPGSLVGAFGPLIGWAAAGGSFADRRVWALAVFFFMWQIPHFWLLLLKYGREYEAAGYPSLTTHFTESQLRRLTFVWMVAMAVSSLLIPMTGGLGSVYGLVAFIGAGVWIIARGTTLVFRETAPEDGQPPVFRRAFMDINLYALVVTVVISVDAVVR